MNLTFDAQTLTLTWEEETTSAFTALWLRDNHPAARTANGQRLHEMASLPDTAPMAEATITDSGMVTILWEDGFQATYDPAILRTLAEPPITPDPVLWDSDLATDLPIGDYDDVSVNGDALRQWLGWVQTYGFALLRNVPPKEGMVTRVVETFGYLRETNYGRYFDVRTVANPNNLAYTGLPLSPHTDNPYRDPVPTLQLLHCLSSDVSGGDSTIVDGLAVADQLRRDHPDHFALLSSVPVTFRFTDGDNDLRATAPILRVDSNGRVTGIRFNNRSLAPFAFPPVFTDRYYAAYLTLARLIDSAAAQVTFHMGAGDLFIVDNERVLHGRTGFSGSGTRHLQGCYADRDGLYSRLQVLAKESNVHH